jgi:holdfast attachment protein HfaA
MRETETPRLPGFARQALGLTALVGVVAGQMAPAADAQRNPARNFSGEFEQPYGLPSDVETQPIDVGTRDLNGNRVILDGRMLTGDDLSNLPPGLYNYNGLLSGGAGFSGAGSATAIGNQLNVITQGSWNTVIVTNTQINNGDINANTNVLNGGLNLND